MAVAWKPVAVGAIVFLAWLFARAWWTVRTFDPDRPARSAAIFDVQGRLIGSVGAPRSAFVPLDRIPRALVEAVLATEDTRFYQHPGIDPVGIARALLANVRARGVVQGGSTITQQLARTLFLTTERTLVRKLDEAAIALMLERRFSKDRILELYLNRVYFGEGATGVGAAAFTYFGKLPSQLSLGESAMLAGLIRAPSALSPYRDMDASLRRRRVVLARMVEVGYLSPAQAEAAASEPVHLAGVRGGIAPWYIDYLAPILERQFGFNLVQRGGLRVHTGFDLRMQEAAIRALGRRQGAIVAIDPRSGDVKAMVGGRDYLESQFNRATEARRQPGSAFKPFVYAVALEQGWQLNSIVQDVPRDFDGYRPHNYRDRYWGPVTLKHALVMSLNVGSVWLASQVGVDRALALASALGITTLTPDDRNLAATLGGLRVGVSPLEMAQAYAAFANGGLSYPVRPFVRVVDEDGYVWYDQPSPQGRRVLSPQVAYLLTDALRDALQRGTGQVARLDRPAAGKTGTTDRLVSAWFVGYTPDLVAAVYVGNDDGTPVGGTGGVLAAPIWKAFMEGALRGRPSQDFPVPDGVVTGIDVDIFSGRRAGGLCRWVERDAFVAGTEPSGWSLCVIGIQPAGKGARPQEPFAGSEAPLTAPAEPGGGAGAPLPSEGGEPSGR
ncbi:PBP1A family penicillin-binding protein [Carboxydochorda subterranea]|uniref:PBP1A family penicillin-binding protein n=1 Tax=Carboxydichorda subterranea TaxID=3109565 RepID=A0ABZ1BZ01_9FIRM|nr:PBP1A family penicillin-binding protein [Limnochorda sp. L945t]WRP17750.1 PBP1A family penicillin-binding protein [Limnochorda sp. L945t]